MPENWHNSINVSGPASIASANVPASAGQCQGPHPRQRLRRPERDRTGQHRTTNRRGGSVDESVR